MRALDRLTTRRMRRRKRVAYSLSCSARAGSGRSRYANLEAGAQLQVARQHAVQGQPRVQLPVALPQRLHTRLEACQDYALVPNLRQALHKQPEYRHSF